MANELEQLRLEAEQLKNQIRVSGGNFSSSYFIIIIIIVVVVMNLAIRCMQASPHILCRS